MDTCVEDFFSSSSSSLSVSLFVVVVVVVVGFFEGGKHLSPVASCSLYGLQRT